MLYLYIINIFIYSAIRCPWFGYFGYRSIGTAPGLTVSVGHQRYIGIAGKKYAGMGDVVQNQGSQHESHLHLLN